MPDALKTILGILIGTVILVIAVFAYDLASGDSFHRAYDRAQMKDLEYARKHPGCSFDEAHRERDKVYRRHGLG